ALWGHRQQARAAGRSGYLDGVLGAARLVAEGDTPAPALTDLVARQITDVLGSQTVDVDRVGLPYDDYVAIPVHRGARVVGHFLVTASSRLTYPTAEQRRVAVL